MNVRERLRYKFFTIIGLAVSAVLVAYPEVIKPIKPVYNFFNKAKVNLGLDLQGGIHLEYKADTSNLDSSKKTDALQGVQDVIERRINAFGVGEPLIQTAKSGKDDLIIVELPGVKDIEEAKQRIKDTPFLEFKEEGTGNQLIHEIHAAHILIAKNGGLPSADESDQPQLNDEEQKKKAEEILKKSLAGEDFTTLAKENSDDPGSKETGGDLGFVQKGAFVPEFDKVLFEGNLKDGQIYPQLVETQFGWHIIKKIEEKDVPNQAYVSTGLTGKKSQERIRNLFRTKGFSEPEVSIKFDAEGTKLFADITKRNLEKTVAIYLDGQPISTPRVQSEITSGDAVITGSFTVDEAKQLAQRLNEGALPIPLILVSQQSVEATLGMESLQKSLKAGIIGLIAVMIFMIIYYRFLGIIASFALIVYTAIMVSIIKLSAYSPWEITLTLSGIAGIILSIGMAVDANILIFERTKEEIRRGRNISSAIEEGFKRAWTSIRDGNLSTIITSIILIFFGTGFVKGFAVTLILGVLVSLFSAIVIVRNILRFIGTHWLEERMWIVMRNKKNKEE